MRLTILATIGALTVTATSFAQDRRPARDAPPAPRGEPVETAAEGAEEPEDRGDEAEAAAEEDAGEATAGAPSETESEADEDVAEGAETDPELEVEPEVEPVAPSLPAAEPAEATIGQCSAKALRTVSEERAGALVHVEAPGARGLGFVFYSRRHVLTPASVVDTGRGIRVRFDPNGPGVRAKVVSIDEASDLALLELASPAPVSPLRAASRPAKTGDSVMTLTRSLDFAARHRVKKNRKYLRARGKHLRRAADTLVQTGTVTFASGGRLRTNALRGGHARWGAPILDCDGHVVGVATSPISDESAGLASVNAVHQDVADDSVYRGRWSVFHPHAGLVGQIDHTASEGFGKRDKWLGFSVGTALIGHDRWYLPARFTATWLVAPDLDEPFAKRRGYRLQGSAGLGYRIMLRGGAAPFYIVPVVGGTVMYDKITTERTEFFVDAACPDGGCRVSPQVLTERVSDLRVMPTFGAGLGVGFGELSYQFILDTEQTERSVHQLTLGVQF